MNIKANVVLVKNQKVKGSASVVLDDCFKIRDIVILAKNGTGELFVAMPYKVLKNGNKVSVAYPLTSEFRAQLQQIILEEYMKLLAKEAETDSKDNNAADTEVDEAYEVDDTSEEE